MRGGGPVGWQEGRNPKIRTLGTEAEIFALFDALKINASTPGTRPRFDGEWFDVPGGGFGLRYSTKYGPTLEIDIPGVPIETIHLPRSGR